MKHSETTPERADGGEGKLKANNKNHFQHIQSSLDTREGGSGTTDS